MGVCVLGFVRLCRQGVAELIDAFPRMLEMFQNGLVIFIHCRSGHSRGPAFRKGWFFVGGASSFFGFDKRAAVSGDVFQRGSVLKCFGLNQVNRCNFRLGRKGFSAHPRQGIINMTLQPTRISLNRVWADRFARCPCGRGRFVQRV